MIIVGDGEYDDEVLGMTLMQMAAWMAVCDMLILT